MLSDEQLEALRQVGCARHKADSETFICRPCADAEIALVERIVAEHVEAARTEERSVARKHYAAFCGSEAEMARLWVIHEQYIEDNADLTERLELVNAALRDLGVKREDGSTIWVTQHEVVRAVEAAEHILVERIEQCLADWNRGLDIDEAHEMDPARRLIRDVRAALTYPDGTERSDGEQNG